MRCLSSGIWPSSSAASTSKLPQLHLRELGLKHVPAVPVDLAALPDTLIKLGLRGKQCEQAYQGLSRTFTIAGRTDRAHAFLLEAADANRAAARASLQAFLSSSPSEISPSVLAGKTQETRRLAAPRRATAARAISSQRCHSTIRSNGRCPGPCSPTLSRGPPAAGGVGGDGRRDAARQGERRVLPEHRPRGLGLQPAAAQRRSTAPTW